MPKVDLNSALANIRGAVGDLVFLELNGQVVVRRKPKRKVPRTEAEKAQNQRMAKAARYAKAVQQDAEKRADYERIPRPRGLGLFHIAVRDFHHPPAVEDIDLTGYSGKKGETVRVKATDDTGVVEVLLRITSMNDELVEEGLARFDAAQGAWLYTATKDLSAGQTVSVCVSAKDRPGNVATRTALAYGG